MRGACDNYRWDIHWRSRWPRGWQEMWSIDANWEVPMAGVSSSKYKWFCLTIGLEIIGSLGEGEIGHWWVSRYWWMVGWAGRQSSRTGCGRACCEWMALQPSLFRASQIFATVLC